MTPLARRSKSRLETGSTFALALHHVPFSTQLHFPTNNRECPEWRDPRTLDTGYVSGQQAFEVVDGGGALDMVEDGFEDIDLLLLLDFGQKRQAFGTEL